MNNDTSIPADLTIIVPVFNADRTLDECLRSITVQTRRPREVIVMDGGSTDKTAEISLSYCHRFPWIVFVSEKDEGIYDAMNKGIGRAVGEWIYFLGSDDRFVTPDVLETVFHSNAKAVQSSDLLYGNVFWGNSTIVYMGPADLKKLYFHNLCHQAVFYRQSVFSRIGKYETKYPVLADWKFNLRCFFDPHLRKSYINVVIAVFALGGSSGRKPDPFEAEKEEFYFLLAKKLPLHQRRLLAQALYPAGKKFIGTGLRAGIRFRKWMSSLKSRLTKRAS